MNNYQMVLKLGEGGYGKVYKLRKLNAPPVPDGGTEVFYAGKILKPTATADGIPGTTVREVSIMRILPPHKNVIKLEDVIPYGETIALIFEYAKSDLFKLLHEPQYTTTPLPANQIKWLFFQMLAGLAHLHKNNIIHRDIKPENILLDVNTIPKICDFGLARNYSVPLRQLSSKAVTLWYRPPELLWGSVQYSTAVDIWSMGCLLVQMFIGMPLFPVKVDEEDKMRRDIFKIRGTPTVESWPGFFRLPKAQQAPPQYTMAPTEMKSIFTQMKRTDVVADGGSLFDLIEKMLQLNPDQRITALDALNHPWFDDIPIDVRNSSAV